MKQTTKAMFNRFKKEFNRLIPILGINGYKFYFEHRDLPGSFAEVHINQAGHAVTVVYGLNIEEGDYPGVTPEENAKHEAIHVLISRLGYLGEGRYIGSSEIDDEQERLVRILEKII